MQTLRAGNLLALRCSELASGGFSVYIHVHVGLYCELRSPMSTELIALAMHDLNFDLTRHGYDACVPFDLIKLINIDEKCGTAMVAPTAPVPTAL